jgi:blue copper oxidase
MTALLLPQIDNKGAYGRIEAMPLGMGSRHMRSSKLEYIFLKPLTSLKNMIKPTVLLFVFFKAIVSTHSIQAQGYNQPLFMPPLLSGTTLNLSFNTGTMQFYPGLTTDTYGINGNYLGPTLILNKGDSMSISVTNNLPETTSCHWHGLHVPALYDGGPHSPINPGATWNADFRVMNNAATYWYHPHMHMNTMPQVDKGLAGMIIVKDSVESLLDLPRTYGLDDFPIILQDKKYNQSGQMIPVGLGDSIQVNGTVNAYLNCPSQVVRLRLLNASNARIYNIGFSDQRNFYVITNDGGLLTQPYSVNRLLLSNGERVEILVDLSSDTVGHSFFLQSYASEMAIDIPGAITGANGGSGPLEAVDFPLMSIGVTSPTANPVLTIPVTLATSTPWNPANANRIRNKTISGNGTVNGQGNFMMDSTFYSHMVINDTIILNDIEIWNITNHSNMAHPVHLHDVQFYIISRDGITPPPYESGLKDVVLISPNETVSLITKFEDFADNTVPYMYHCHNLAHEDMGMMLQFIVVDNTSGIVSYDLEKDIVYPNPSSEKWLVRIHGRYPEKVMLFSNDGKAINTDIIITGKEISIGEKNLNPGIYIVKIAAGENVITKKLVKL